MDMRSADQAARVAALQDAALRVNSGGSPPRVSAEWMLPKALWLAEREPHLYDTAATICEYQDFLNLRLTGVRCGAANNMAVRWHCSTQQGPPLSLLSQLGLSSLAAKWPTSSSSSSSSAPLLPGQLVGGLTPAAAAHLGLLPGTPVAQGGADAFIGMLGLGVVAPGQMALLTGSSHLQLGVVGSELHGPGFFGTYRDAVLPGCHVIEGGQTSTGSVLAWFRRTCCAPGTPYSELDAEAAAVPPGCEGLTALDHFQGNRTPHTDALSRGVLAGLTLKHGRGHVFRALMESVAAGTAVILRTMRAAGYTPECITLAGGAARSELWLQIHADMTGLPLRLTRCADAPMLGCAILAAVAAGMYDSVPSAAAAMVAVEREVRPDPAAVAAYRAPLARYAALYPALAPIFHGKYDNGGQYDNEGQNDRASDGGEAGAGVAREGVANGLPPTPAAAAVTVAAVVPSSTLVGGAGVVSRNSATCTISIDPHDSTPNPNPSLSIPASLSTPSPSSRDIIIAPSILAADFANLGAAVAAAAAAGAPWLHLDVFDGSWAACDNFSIGPPVVAALRRVAGGGLFLDCHLGLMAPGRYVERLAAAGADGITFHWEVLQGGQGGQQDEQRQGQQEAESEGGRQGGTASSIAAAATTAVAVRQLAGRIRSAGMRAGVALAPDTALPEELVELAAQGHVDMVLVMTVPPGFGGQTFRPAALEKVARLRAACPQLLVQVDGGINPATARQAAAAGADVMVAGSFLYGHPQGVAEGMEELRSALKQAAVETNGPSES
ncbi:hypothetical protein Agub_g9774 [Astrephomene gubernaculifera]|uniref:Carbohydrate kinase FGGY C-terminal domain-containing protein n=1 Tax=Astrephomene gubernaculifera TaxID=47775 RepID=A0AAD3HNM9_9CHLO|nr:hypothetical protein Agub_g9774 [Astrephomene gubernaculifera]